MVALGGAGVAWRIMPAGLPFRLHGRVQSAKFDPFSAFHVFGLRGRDSGASRLCVSYFTIRLSRFKTCPLLCLLWNDNIWDDNILDDSIWDDNVWGLITREAFD